MELKQIDRTDRGKNRLYDSPTHHHAAMIRQYPKNWKSSGHDHDQK
jgi:hypothetical protein